MIDVIIEGDDIHFEVEGWDKFWALKSRLKIPLAHVKGARIDEEAARGWWHGVKIWGADLPGVITAGTFFRKGRMVFYDTHKPEHTIVVDLDHEDFDTLVLQVRDPAGAIATIAGAVAART